MDLAPLSQTREGTPAMDPAGTDQIVSGRSGGRRWAVFMAASGQLSGRLWAVSRGRRQVLSLRGTLRGKWRSPLLIRARLCLRVPAYWLVSGYTRHDGTARRDMVRKSSSGGLRTRAWRIPGLSPLTDNVGAGEESTGSACGTAGRSKRAPAGRPIYPTVDSLEYELTLGGIGPSADDPFGRPCR